MGFISQLKDQLTQTAKAFSFEDAIGRVENAGENIFGFYSPTGGNGVSTIVANVADALRLARKRVAVIDFDLMHPSQFRYLSHEQEEVPRSMVDAWIDTTVGASEFSAASSDNFIAIFSTRLEDDVYALAELDIVRISQFITDISMMYDYVLLDMHGDLNSEPVVASLDTCTEVFTVIRPTLGDLEAVYKDNMCAINYNLGARFVNIIQSPVHQLTLTQQDFKELDDIPWKLITNFPYVNAVSQVGQNYGLFATGSIGIDTPSVSYRQSIKFLAELILNYHSANPIKENNSTEGDSV